MKIKYAFLFLFAAALMVGCGTTSSPTSSGNGGSSSGGNQTVNGTVQGKGYRDHRVNFQANRDLTISLTSNNNSCYFNVLTAKGEAIHNGSNEGNVFKAGVMQFTGYYTVRVYLMGAANDNNQKVNYTLRY